ncbi:hypothetical protein SADUNF_Sadunf17G0136200 [Salix dunnii]|uniref:Uncharacterized protein n=1 Tax=Salix dunnii TaxID=1413687 RepID=A0A835J747_9ROSI|nr:hypothetical protein SADUNF_Sadunf17G0136200 [Salix dunnii]
MGSQGKTRYLTIILLVAFILLSCSNLILADSFDCPYPPPPPNSDTNIPRNLLCISVWGIPKCLCI